MPDDQQDWKKISRNDAAAFNAFYLQNAPRLRRFVRQIVGNEQAAEDVVQDTFTQIWKRPSGFDPGRGSLRGYLYGIGRKRAAHWWRQQKASDELRDTDDPCRVELQSVVNDAFQRLPEEQRALLWLREVEGLSYAELASALEIPIGTVRSRLFAAREALRHIWHARRLNTEGEQR